MQRIVLEQTRIHPAAREKLAQNHRDIVEECEAAVRKHDVVVIGMKQNPHPKRAKKLLAEQKVPFEYLEYGSYFGPWRRRNALKMWTGWPTFPMIFVKGTFIGGTGELDKLIKSGELAALLGPQS
jgi:monothiol glutaredoxin